MIVFFIAIISGILMSVQGVFNTGVTKHSSLWSANCFVQLTAFLVCFAIWALTDRTSFARVLTVRPTYMLLGGVFGAFITYTVIVSMSRMGPAKAVMCIVIAQLVSAYLIELLGLFGTDKQPFSIRKVIGMLIAIGGITIFKWK